MNDVPRLHVLVVDDVEEVREVFARFLGLSGMRVTQVDGGRAALAAAARATPDLVVTDISMADMDGLELCRRMRAEPTLSQVPIVVVSANAPLADPEVWAAGCDAVVEKPCSRSVLITTVEGVLATAGGRRSARSPSTITRPLQQRASGG